MASPPGADALSRSVATAEALFAALPSAHSAAGAQQVRELHAEFDRHWAGVAAAAAELDAEEAQLSSLLQERSRLSKVCILRSLPSRRDVSSGFTVHCGA
jgi:hypothetical protein